MVTTEPDGIVQTKLDVVVEALIPDASNNSASATLFIEDGIKIWYKLAVIINDNLDLIVWSSYESQTGLETIVPNFSQS